MHRTVVCLVAAVVSAGFARQEWRATALASFDQVWQTVNETHYDPKFGGVDWQAVRAELKPRAEAAESADGVRTVIREMLARLRQSHFMLLAPTSADVLPGTAALDIEFRVTDSGVLVTKVTPQSAAERAGLQPGDAVLSIDSARVESGKRAVGNTSDVRAARLEIWRQVFRSLHGPSGSTAVLRIKSPDRQEREIRVVRTEPDGEMVAFGNLPPLEVKVDATELRTPHGRRVGVIGFNIWMAPVGPPFAAAVDRFRTTDALVIDLRGNPGGLAPMLSGIAGHVFDDGRLLGTMRMRTRELVFRANPRQSTPDGRRVVPFSGPVAILVDELSGSASECFAGALQSLKRARIFGRQTMGQALPALTKQLPNGDVLMYAVGDFLTATGGRLEGVGVIPDERVPLSARALAAGRDLPLEAALRWIDTEKRR